MGKSIGGFQKFLLFSLISHAIVFFVWGKVIVQRSIPVYGQTIEVSLKKIEYKKPKRFEKPVPKKEKKVEKKKEVVKRDKSISLDKKKKPVEKQEIEQEEVASEAKPSYGFTPRPAYPSRAIMRGYEGKVTLSVHVLPNGEPKEVVVFQSSGYKILDNAALKAVKKWKFLPAQRGFKAVDSWVKVPIEFKLEGRE